MSMHDDVIDYDLLWDTIKTDLPPLMSRLKMMNR